MSLARKFAEREVIIVSPEELSELLIKQNCY